MNRGKEFKLILHQTIFILKFQVHPIFFFFFFGKWHSSGEKMKFILFWVLDKPMLFIFQMFHKTRRENQFIILLFTNTQLSKMHIEALSIFDDQTYQVPCNVYLTTWDLPRSNVILLSWKTYTIDYPLSAFSNSSFLPCSFHQHLSKFKSLSIKNKNLPWKPLPRFFCLSLCSAFCWCIFFWTFKCWCLARKILYFLLILLQILSTGDLHAHGFFIC